MSDLLTELRSYKIYDMAMFDFSLSIVIFYYISKKFFNLSTNKSLVIAISSIPLSIFIHKLFDVETGLTKKFDNFIKPTDQQTQTKQPTTKQPNQTTKPKEQPTIKPVDIKPVSYIPTSVLNKLQNETIINTLSSSNPLWVRTPNFDWVSKYGTVALEETGISAGEVASAIGKIAIGFL